MEGATTQQRYLTPVAPSWGDMIGEGFGRRSAPVGAILLAGGASTRMGGAPKGLLEVDGVSALRRMATICEVAGLSPVVAVVGAHASEIRRALSGTSPFVVEHSGWAAGRTGTIQAGLAALGPAAGTLLWPVDHPFVEAKTVRTLVERAEADAMAVWVIPTFDGRGGHPIVLDRATFGPILELPADRALRSLLVGYGPQVLRVAVDDPEVVENIDTPESYRDALVRRRLAEVDREWTAG
jgi:molybdenum cofactor cytidylyltransferase